MDERKKAPARQPCAAMASPSQLRSPTRICRSEAGRPMHNRFATIARSLSHVSCVTRPTELGPEFAMDTFEAATGLALTLRRHLGPIERIILAEAAMQALDRGDAAELAESVLNDTGHGWPLPHPHSISAEAASWAAVATRPERVALLAAIWHRLAEPDRAEFLRAVS